MKNAPRPAKLQVAGMSETNGTELDRWRWCLRTPRTPIGTPMTKKNATKKKLRVIMLADESLLPDGDLKDFSEKQRELRKTEFDVRDAIEALGHDLFSIGVSDDLST